MAKALIPAGAAKAVASHIVVDKNDVLAVAISKAERFMQTHLAEAHKEIKRLERSIKDHSDNLTKYVGSLADKLAKPGIAKLEAAKEACGSKAKVDSSCEMDVAKRTFKVNITFKNDGWGANTFGQLKGDFDSAATELAESLDKNGKLLAEAREAAVDWRRKLSQIPTLERQYRARLAEAALSKTEEGQQLLDALSGDFEADVLALPGI